MLTARPSCCVPSSTDVSVVGIEWSKSIRRREVDKTTGRNILAPFLQADWALPFALPRSVPLSDEGRVRVRERLLWNRKRYRIQLILLLIE